MRRELSHIVFLATSLVELEKYRENPFSPSRHEHQEWDDLSQAVKEIWEDELMKYKKEESYVGNKDGA